jgi:hypothetical protein
LYKVLKIKIYFAISARSYNNKANYWTIDPDFEILKYNYEIKTNDKLSINLPWQGAVSSIGLLMEVP